MSKEDLSLPVKMERLEIEPIKLNKSSAEENPFVVNLSHNQRWKSMNKTLKNADCSNVCHSHINNKHLTICKRKHKKILREPILKILTNCSGINKDEVQSLGKNIQHTSSLTTNSGNVNVSALVDNCNQLRISSEDYDKKLPTSNIRNSKKWWRKDDDLSMKKNESTSDVNRSGPSCSQEALNPPCDVTIDELASYFDTLVHIPKKMSSMAEMMYI